MLAKLVCARDTSHAILAHEDERGSSVFIDHVGCVDKLLEPSPRLATARAITFGAKDRLTRCFKDNPSADARCLTQILWFFTHQARLFQALDRTDSPRTGQRAKRRRRPAFVTTIRRSHRTACRSGLRLQARRASSLQGYCEGAAARCRAGRLISVLVRPQRESRLHAKSPPDESGNGGVALCCVLGQDCLPGDIR